MVPFSKSSMVEILLVEDNPGDQELTRIAFKEGRIANQLHVVDDGEKAMQYLRAEGEYSDRNLPDIILLDLNLPRKNGREVLAEVKQDTMLRKIPVIVLTTSNSEEDILASYDQHANCYLTKPVDFNGFLDVIRRLEDFWLSVVRLPSD